MLLHMLLEVGSIPEPAAAGGTGVGPLFGVDEGMLAECRHVVKRFVALHAGVFLLL